MPEDASHEPRRTLRDHEAFLSSGTRATGVRPFIADSWSRSVAAGVDVDTSRPPITTDTAELHDYRDEHPLSRVFPLLYDVLGRAAEETESLMAVADAHGQLLWVCGQPSLLRRAEHINFVEGALWDEGHAGTNAPGTALRLDQAVTIHAAEHFSREVQRWSCAAAPVHDPRTQAILGIVDITGGQDVASPQTIAMVRAAARMAESELARLFLVEQSLRTGAPRRYEHDLAAGQVLRLEGLGRPDIVATVDGRMVRLSPRHSEMAVILSQHPGGLTGDQLAVQLYAEDMTSSTLRAELVRLRALFGDRLASRPYRLTGEVEADWTGVTAELAAGNVAQALKIYRGPLLPQSEAPGVCDIRDRLERQLRAAVLASGQPELMVAWTRSRWGAEDLQMWQRQLSLLPADSPLRPLAVSEAARLDAEFR